MRVRVRVAGMRMRMKSSIEEIDKRQKMRYPAQRRVRQKRQRP